ncbi:Sulfotransferase [Candidatus Nanopelagicaceae bacterium]
MNYFGALENFLSEKDTSIEFMKQELEVNFTFPDDSWMVHVNRDLAIRYMVDRDLKSDEFTSYSIAILRNPFDRFASFWFNKIVLMGDTTFYRLSKEYFPSLEISNSEAIRESAKKFLISTEFNHLLENDAHLSHQYLSILLEKKYDLYLETKDLSYLPKLLSQNNPLYKCLEEIEFPSHNLTDKVLTENFFDAELYAMVRELYKKDFELIGSLGLLSNRDIMLETGEHNGNVLAAINQARKNGLYRGVFHLLDLEDSKNILVDIATQQRDELTQQRDELTQQRDELTKQRDNLISERDAAAGALSAVVNSRIWRFTKLYRKLRSRKP